ncbi:Hypothetical protein NTJ_01725 [Nesidiocoris tenuis]|uniref:Uncharacterized protein n=1 Tax=Nesidiocoris tenuis TaxID=355587 RepID=A0ABN7A9C8_9HEMI|nr:Hypothetical protein NTJ_01725 [Nesidiocoris tenuis]
MRIVLTRRGIILTSREIDLGLIFPIKTDTSAITTALTIARASRLEENEFARWILLHYHADEEQGKGRSYLLPFSGY